MGYSQTPLAIYCFGFLKELIIETGLAVPAAIRLPAQRLPASYTGPAFNLAVIPSCLDCTVSGTPHVFFGNYMPVLNLRHVPALNHSDPNIEL